MEANALELVQAAAATAVSRRARNAIILDMRELDSFTDFFVICSGVSDTQVEGISDAVLEELEEKWNLRPWHREGARRADWILLDYVDFVVHVFLEEKLEYYNLGHLWAEAPVIEVPDVEVTGYDEYDEDYDELEDYDDEEIVVWSDDEDEN
ncbi:ribosome silencing factor [Candidatus Poribacteria bacterium]|nr:ribosome silencing factor [Candidatus Poribacteria bacterium]